MTPEKSHDFFQVLQHHGPDRGEKTAVLCEGAEVSYALLNDHIGRFGNLLKDRGVRPGERVLIALPDCPDAFYAFLGSMQCGALPVLVNPDLPRGDFEFIREDSRASVLVTVGDGPAAEAWTSPLERRILVDDPGYPTLFANASPVLEVVPHSPDEAAFLFYTTGRNGDLRGVPHRRGDMAFSAENYARGVLNLCQSDVVFSTSKLFLSYGMGNSLVFPLYFGATAVLLPSRPITPDHVFAVIARSRPTVLFAVPTLYGMMLKTLDEGVRLDSLRLCVSAGESLPAGLHRDWKEATGLEILEGIGSMETLHIFISNRPGHSRPGTSGVPVPSYRVRIVGEDGLPVPSGQPGSLQVKGGSIAPFYWNRPELAAETMLEGGWLKTGDIFTEEDGFYTYRGRSDDLFKSGGNWVSPVKVASILREHPRVRDCRVTSRKLEGLLKPIAHVVLNPGPEGTPELARDLRSHVLKRLPKHMCPVQFNFCEEIPGKRPEDARPPSPVADRTPSSPG